MGNKSRGYLSGSLRPTLLLLMLSLLITLPIRCQESLPSVMVTISSRNQTINQVLEEITLQTGYHFTYDAAIINGRQKVQFRVAELLLREALDSLLMDPQLDYRAIDKNIVIYRKNRIAPTPISSTINRALLKGRVVERRSGKPLSYATIALLETSLGSITNQQGEFAFKLPLDLPDPMMVISFMGYKSQVIPVSYPVEEDLEIQLEKELIPLQEVIIRYSDPAKLLHEAINRIPINYLDNHSTMTAFYRESVSRNEHCMILSEAVLDVAKRPYDNKNASDRVRIFKGRKISDLTVEDTVMLKIKSGIYTSLSLDIIKSPPDFLLENFTDLYILDFSDIISYGDNLVYVISFSPRSHILETLFTGSLYIDVENLAIVAADFQFDPEKIQTEQSLFVVSKSRNIRVRPLKAKYHVEYRKLNGRYHVSQVRAFVELKMRKRRKWIGAKYSIQIDMVITNVIPGERLKIDPGEQVRPSIVMSEERFEYDPDFWGIYNIIEPEASLEEALKNIEKCMQEYMENEMIYENTENLRLW